MKRLVTLATAALSGWGLTAAEIGWTVQPNTTADSEIRTEGRCLYAYTASATEVNVNGVQFSRFTATTDSFAGDATVDQSMIRHINWLGDSREAAWTTAGGSAAHKNLLKFGWYKYLAGNLTRTLTLNGLTAGKRYLIQMWMCDARSADKASKTLTLGGVTGNCYADGFGCHFIGTFTADAATQSISLVYGSEGQINAFQVRCLDEAHIVWTGRNTSGESDISMEGSPVYAYKPGEAQSIRGTEFKGIGSNNLSSFGSDISFSPPVATLHRDFCWSSPGVPNGAYCYSPAYSNFVRAAHYSVWPKTGDLYYLRRDVTLKNLRAGLRYLVQLWTFDNRSDYSDRSVVVGNGVVIRHSDGTAFGHGSYAVGTFTAVSSEQTFSCFHRASQETMAYGQEALGPIQVRCLDEEYEGWTVGDTTVDGSVDTRGVSVCAYAGNTTEVSGTKFLEFGVVDGNLFNEVAFVTNGVFHSQHWDRSAFIQGPTVPVSPAVTNLLAGGLFKNDNTPSQDVVISNLQPGRRYLVQAWFMDTRQNRSGNFAGKDFQYRILGTAPLGQYVTGIFRATAEVKTIPFATYNGQINAIQVRQLDSPLASPISWTVSEDKAGEASVSTEGTLLYAYAPWAYTLDNGVSFAEGAPNACEWGNGDIVLNQPYGYRHNAFASADDGYLVNCGWFHTEVVSDSETQSWTLTLGKLKPSYAYIVQLFVADLRNAGSGVRLMSINGLLGRYGPNQDGVAPKGSVFTGRFTADATKKCFAVYYPHYISSAQLNAIQVREIGPVGTAWTGGASGTWTTDGAGWTENGIEKTGVTLWDATAGKARTAWMGADTLLGLGADVTAGGIFGEGALTIGETETAKRLSVLSEIATPQTIVNAVWDSSVITKTLPGTTVFAGACPHLTAVNVSAGRAVLDGAVPNRLKISVLAPGQLGFSTMRTLGGSVLSGNGTLAGPGGLQIATGGEVGLPSGFTYTDGFAWELKNGTVAVLPDGADASRFSIRIDNPKAYVGGVAVRAAGNFTGKPKFSFSESGWRCRWNTALSGWEPVGNGMILIFQ